MKAASHLKNYLTKDLSKYLNEIYLDEIKQHDADNKVVEFSDVKIRYCTYKDFTYLFKTIFIREEYHFSTDKKQPFIIDCGSNIGMSVTFFKSIFPEAEIIAFEPNHEAFTCLTQNIEGNNFSSVSANNKALSNTEGTIEFYTDGNEPGSPVASTLEERLSNQKIEVSATRLSNYINKDVDFLKMDIEGAEVCVLKELIANNKAHYIKQMVIEYHHHIDKNKDDMSVILSLLEQAGFGYQIAGHPTTPFIKQEFQDILIYVYQK